MDGYDMILTRSIKYITNNNINQYAELERRDQQVMAFCQAEKFYPELADRR